jgi:hypothetical protein
MPIVIEQADTMDKWISLSCVRRIRAESWGEVDLDGSGTGMGLVDGHAGV